jgi:hypothetical protein
MHQRDVGPAHSEPFRRSRVVVAVTGVALAAFGGADAIAQRVPRGALATVPVVHDCDETGGDVAVSRLDPPAVYVCDRVVRLIRAKDPGAEHFYFVHEFGHIALQTSSESAADCWAARELVAAPNGRRLAHRDCALPLARRRAERALRLAARAERVRSCADEAMPGWDAIDASASPPRH